MYTDLGVYTKVGVMTERDPEFCTVRIRTLAGNLSVDQVWGLAKIAKNRVMGLFTGRELLILENEDDVILAIDKIVN
jgi:dissimilatory sulfite reductase (desulfoviridin) alpha/beta subunit